jgi:hypothetical protein
MQSHCPYRQSILLQQALASNKMRIAFLLGAGCPVSIRIPEANDQTRPLIPDIAGLTSLVSNTLREDDALKNSYATLLARFDANSRPNIEEILSHLRALLDVVRQGAIDGLNRAALQALDTKICELIAGQVRAPLPEATTPYHHLAAWISATSRAHPIEVFTPNYDLLVEQAFESRRVPYFDGFVGSREAFFDLTSMESDALPARWARLWKLHGSINWWRTATEDVVRKEQNSTGDRHMIYPSHLKYDQSRRLPYLAMLDRLRDFLGRGQAVVVCCGYSFADQHLNEVIMNGLRSNPTAMCFGLMYGGRAQYKEGMLCASRHPNLSLLAEDGAVLGTLDRDWHNIDEGAHPLHGLSSRFEPDAADGQAARNKFLLGDFKKLGEFLAYQLNRSEDHASTTTA